MKKTLLLALFSFLSICCSVAQTEQQKKTVESLKDKYQLDDDYGYSYTRVLENLNETKEGLHAKALAFFPYLVKGTYDAREIIQHENASEGVIVAKLAWNDLASHSNMAHVYNVSATPIFRIDIKDNRLRFIISIKKLTVYHYNASGIFVKESFDEIPSTELPPFKPDKKKKVNNMYYSAFIKAYNTAFLTFEQFEKSIREGNTIEKESKDDW